MLGNYDPFFGGRPQRQSWRDVMQVCLNGHVINTGVKKYPEHNKEFCNQCGAKTITECPSCGNAIPGDMQDTGVTVIGFRKNAPTFCESCGEKYPWTEKEKIIKNKKSIEDDIEVLQKIFSKFHTVVKQLRKRYSNRSTIDINDEYDVQDLLRALLYLKFDDIRPEEWSPSYAGKSSRVDFLLKEEEIVIEVKMTRKGLADKEVGEQLIMDIANYQGHPNCKQLVCFIYDPEGRIRNPKGLITDLQKQSKEELKILIFINPM